MKNEHNKTKVVTIGGGTGTYAVLTGLKKYTKLDLSAVVAVTDDGGSSGKLRDEFGFLPAGDLRQSIAALATVNGPNSLMRKLFNYRFQKGGKGLEGHSFGNLLITAITDIVGDQEKAINQVSEILKIQGKVIPISIDNVEIAVQQEDGTITIGESKIKDNTNSRDLASRIIKIWLQPEAYATSSAVEAIRKADYIIIGPGGLFTSLITNLLVKGIKESISKSKAKIIFVMNLMADGSQTYKFSAQDHLDTLIKYLDQYPDYVIVNNKSLDKDLVKRYTNENDFPVNDNLNPSEDYTVLRENLITEPRKAPDQKDFKTKRSFIRHNPERLSRLINGIINQN